MDLTAPIKTIREEIKGFESKGLKIFLTSSFQTHSLPLLHIISPIRPKIPVYFLNTGFHFPETLQFRDKVSGDLGLDLRILSSPIPKSSQKNPSGNFYFTSDPDYCCHMNKVMPLEPVISAFDVWVSGVRADQSEVRKKMKKKEKGRGSILRYHPMLDWDPRMIYFYRKQNDLPSHPLEDRGFDSIGCEPCTRKPDPETMDRGGRWYGMRKTECGLHISMK